MDQNIWSPARRTGTNSYLLVHALYIHANVNNKTVRGRPSTNCRCEEAETKTTVTLMASLVIKRPFDVGTQQPLLSPSSSMPLTLSVCFFINTVFRECPFAHSPKYTSDIWLALVCVALFGSNH